MAESDAEFVERVSLDLNLSNTADILRLFALARRGAEAQWRPIETAPKDGTRFVALMLDDHHRHDRAVIVKRVDDSTWPWEGDGIGYSEHAFSHFMPLPTPPKGNSDD